MFCHVTPLLGELFDQTFSSIDKDKYKVSLNGPSWSFPVGLAAGHLIKRFGTWVFFKTILERLKLEQ